MPIPEINYREIFEFRDFIQPQNLPPKEPYRQNSSRGQKFAIFGHFREIKNPRKMSLPQILKLKVEKSILIVVIPSF